MKKILLLLSVFVLFSCEQEDLNNLVDNSKVETGQQSAVKGRAASTIADFDPIAELDGIQVNIINMGTESKMYLSCVEKGNKVDLYDKDDGSMRQRWYIGDTYIKLVGGNQDSGGDNLYVLPDNNINEGPSPVLRKSVGFPMAPFWAGQFDYINNDLVIELLPLINVSSYNVIQYLQPETAGSSTLKYKKGNNDMSTHWRLELVGDDYEFEKIQYVKATGDYVGLQAPMLRQYEYYNSGKPEPGEATFQINATVEYTSSFSESQTVSISNKVSVSSNIGTPTAVSGNVSAETTTTYGWGFTTTKTERKSVSITDTYKYIVPANKDIQMNVYIASYDMNVTYVMTVRRKHDGKLFKVKGKWTGVQGTNIKYQAVDLHSGEELNQESRRVDGILIR